MPLRDHFNPPLGRRFGWEGLHTQWPSMLVIDLSRRLPPRYRASPKVRLGAAAEVDIGTLDQEHGGFEPSPAPAAGGAATAVWAPPQPDAVQAGLDEQDEFEVFVYDQEGGDRLVAAVEFVSPSNKDRSDSRGTFVAKCAELVRQRVTVAIVDVVTTRHFNLFAELLELLDRESPVVNANPPDLYASACRNAGRNGDAQLSIWTRTLTLGQPLPTLPLWLSDQFAVPLELEATYEQACQVLRVP